MGNVVAMPPNPMSTQPQNIPAQIVLQKQQMRAMHPNMMNQQQQMIGTSMRQVEFRQSAPANVVVQQNQIQSNQVQQFQQQQVNKHSRSFAMIVFLIFISLNINSNNNNNRQDQ